MAAEARRLAAQLLEENWRGNHTVPASGLYPHQWSWDSGFIAIGLRHVSPARARQEMDSLLDAQWEDGRIPQIVYDAEGGDGYSPGPGFWRSELLAGSPVGIQTAGLVQPPNHALAVWKVFQSDPASAESRQFLEAAFPRLVKWHEYLATRRTHGPGLLASIVHPWESGTDNSPLWDQPLERVPTIPPEDIHRPDLAHAGEGERPGQREYGKYYWLAHRYRDHDCDDRDTGYPFLVEDPLFNALWVVSELALAKIATELGLDDRSHIQRAAELTSALEDLFDPALGCYVARDVLTTLLLPKATVNGLAPLLIPKMARAKTLLRTLKGPRFLGEGAQLVPSYDATASDMNPGLYWRGPAWFNMAWLVIVGLRTVGESRLAGLLSVKFVELAVLHRFPEYVNPWTGRPHGTRDFSWTAALTLEIVNS